MQLKPPIIFTIKGMAKVLVGQLVDNARLVRREWGEDDSNGTSTAHPPTQQQLSLSLSLSVSICLSLSQAHTHANTHAQTRACVRREIGRRCCLRTKCECRFEKQSGVPLQPRHILESHRRMMRQVCLCVQLFVCIDAHTRMVCFFFFECVSWFREAYHQQPQVRRLSPSAAES